MSCQILQEGAWLHGCQSYSSRTVTVDYFRRLQLRYEGCVIARASVISDDTRHT